MFCQALKKAGRNNRRSCPVRVHNAFSGLPSIHACANAQCTERRLSPGGTALLGKITEPRTIAAAAHASLRFIPTEIVAWRSSGLLESNAGRISRGTRLAANSVVSSGCPSRGSSSPGGTTPDQVKNADPVWMDIATGRLFDRMPKDTTGFRLLYRAMTGMMKIPLDLWELSLCTRRTKTGATQRSWTLRQRGAAVCEPDPGAVRQTVAA